MKITKLIEGGKIIAVCGPIGAGKTTLVNAIQQYLTSQGVKSNSYDESVYPIMLKQFLENQKKYAYVFQMFMLTRRQLNYALAAVSDTISILDRSLADDYVFALMQHRMGNISDDEFAAYKEVYESFKPNHPDIIIYLKVSVDTALSRIKKRDRDGETSYTREYITALHNTYDEVLKGQYNGLSTKIIELDWNEDKEI